VINYETDEERAEAIKKWWKENGLSIFLGVGIGLGAIFGWRAWIDYRETVRQQASAAFEQLLVEADAGDARSARAQSKLLREEFAATAYATLASLVRARVEVEAGDLAAARTALEQAIAGSPAPGIRRIAALRLARVLIAEGELAGAADLIARHDGSGFGGAFSALRGEIAEAQGRGADARAAYERALAAGAPNPDQVRMRLDNILPPAS